MTKRPRQDPPLDAAGDDEDARLTLEDSNQGSTHPFAAGEAGDSAGGASGSAGSASDFPASSQESSPGGFETELGRLVVNRGLVAPDELELCESLLGETSTGESPRTLSDLLIESGFVTKRQLDRLRSEFDAKRSPQQIPGYRVKRKIGAGAMATVFLARQLSLDRLVAIKILPKKFSANEKFIERFYKEGQAAAKLNHPNIVGALDVGRAGDHHYFVMEHVDGRTIYDRIVEERRIDEAVAIKIIHQVALALQHAHERGLVHRDVKPKNIMITAEGVVKLADLGLARAMSDKEAAKAEAGRAYGTPYYISPEQIRGEVTIGPAADIYGLGATFYHMVTGRVPFEGKNPSAVMHKHLKTPLRPPDHVNPNLSAGCAQVIEKMMAKKLRDRYESAADVLEDLGLIARGEPPHFAHRTLDPTALPPPTGEPVIVPRRVATDGLAHNPAFMIVLVLLIVSLLANAVLLVLMVS